MFQITEDDLAELERTVPQFWEAMGTRLAANEPGGNKLRVQLRRVKDILSNVRWDYGPPADVVIIPAGDPPEPPTAPRPSPPPP